jgi:hypothetical protein
MSARDHALNPAFERTGNSYPFAELDKRLTRLAQEKHPKCKSWLKTDGRWAFTRAYSCYICGERIDTECTRFWITAHVQRAVAAHRSRHISTRSLVVKPNPVEDSND